MHDVFKFTPSGLDRSDFRLAFPLSPISRYLMYFSQLSPVHKHFWNDNDNVMTTHESEM